MRIPMGRPGATAYITGSREAPCLTGTVKFYAMGKNTLVVADIGGLPNNKTGFFALHIHEGRTCQSSGGHHNPDEQSHPLHAGDLPPLLSCNGKAFLAILTGRFLLCDIIGKTVVIHGDADDFASQPAGNPGDKIACGIICPLL